MIVKGISCGRLTWTGS